MNVNHMTLIHVRYFEGQDDGSPEAFLDRFEAYQPPTKGKAE